MNYTNFESVAAAMQAPRPAPFGAPLRAPPLLASLLALAVSPALAAMGPDDAQRPSAAPSHSVSIVAVGPGPAKVPDASKAGTAENDDARNAATAADSPLYWYDGGRRQPLRVDGSQVADFRRATKGALRPSGEVEKSASGALPEGVSPVLRNAGAAPGATRALPGGVIVALQAPPAGGDATAREAQARARLQAQGLAPVRAIDPAQRIWLVEAPAGIESLELANRLHESGAFESVEPNWWRPRALK